MWRIEKEKGTQIPFLFWCRGVGVETFCRAGWHGRETVPQRGIAQAPWRQAVPLPPSSRVRSLAVSDSGDRIPDDLVNWVAASF